MNLVTFGASYSVTSINRAWAAAVGKRILELAGKEGNIQSLDLNKYDLPLYTVEREAQIGLPEPAKWFVEDLAQADLIVVSLAEYNGSYTAGFKNLFDWASRVELKFFQNKPVVVTSTAPGPRGGLTVLQTAAERFPRHGASQVVVGPALPGFKTNFDLATGRLTSDEWQLALDQSLQPLLESL
jgi:NAD(P)H-dependent FMN reductase